MFFISARRYSRRRVRARTREGGGGRGRGRGGEGGREHSSVLNVPCVYARVCTRLLFAKVRYEFSGFRYPSAVTGNPLSLLFPPVPPPHPCAMPGRVKSSRRGQVSYVSRTDFIVIQQHHRCTVDTESCQRRSGEIQTKNGVYKVGGIVCLKIVR